MNTKLFFIYYPAFRRNQDSSVSIVSKLQAGRPKFDKWQRRYSEGAKGLQGEADPLLPFSTEVMNAWK